MNKAIIPTSTEHALDTDNHERMLAIGAAFDNAAKAGVFADYTDRRAKNSLRRHSADLALFATYLTDASFLTDASGAAVRLQYEANAWVGITYGLVAGFVRWQLHRGYAVASINARLSTVKQYAKLAFQADAMTAEQYALICTVKGFSRKEQTRLDEKRGNAGTPTRKSTKKSAAVPITPVQVVALKSQPDTAQGRRDALLMCLLLDHGLRCGEIAALRTSSFDLDSGTFTFYREKVGKTQTHNLTKDTLKAARAWFDGGYAIAGEKLLRASAKSKDGDKLGASGMTTRAITKRVEYLGRKVGIEGLSAHDGRHSWATRAANNGTDLFKLQEAGGWNGLTRARLYVQAAAIANEGVKLGED